MDFERLDVWKLSARLSVDVYRELAGCRDFGFKDQITRSALSVPSNIAEGWSRESRKEKSQFLAIAQGSLSELHTQLLLCERLSWIQCGPLQETYGLADETSRMLTTLRRRFRSE